MFSYLDSNRRQRWFFQLGLKYGRQLVVFLLYLVQSLRGNQFQLQNAHERVVRQHG